ncbi:MAG: glycosyltransferase family 2 protein [Bacteroidetes bacterium]|nr:MAG: glycosyltransferase family 2 protein [Bacteroidota bacterium]
METDRSRLRVNVIIPAFNEAASIGRVVADVPPDVAEEVIVVSNGSTDATEEQARVAGATVLREERKGYGFACLKGMSYIAAKPVGEQPDVVIFLDGDYSDYPEEMPALLAPLQNGQFDLVIGSRATGERERGAMLPQQVFGNWLATTLIRLLYQTRFTDLGPFRAIRYARLLELNMQDKTYGWTVEMQVKAAKMGLRCTEVPVRYRKRIGVSKVTGTVRGTILAGYKILTTIFRLL